MQDNSDKILTRSQRQMLEKEKEELSFNFLQCTVTISILKHLQKDISSRGKKINLDNYLKMLGKELKTKDIELYIEFDKNIKLSEKDQLYIGSVEVTNEFFKNVIKDILKYRKTKNFDILKHLSKRIKAWTTDYQNIIIELQEIEGILYSQKKVLKTKKPLKSKRNVKLKKYIENDRDEDVDEHGNVKGLIDYDSSSEESEDNEKGTIKKIRDYGKYVHRLKGKELDSFVKSQMKDVNNTKEKNTTTNTTKKYVPDSSSEEDEESEGSYNSDEESEIYDEDSDFSDYDDEESELLDLLGDEWEKKDLDYLRLRHPNTNEKKRDLDYFCNLDDSEKDRALELIETINNMNEQHKPLLFKVIESGMSIDNKAVVVKKLEGIESPEHAGSDFYKLKSWVEGLLNVPFGVYVSEKISRDSNKNSIKRYLNKSKCILDKSVYGHEDAKRHILQILAQNITNEKSNGNIFGIQGPMGNGKTTLVEQGIAKALNRPFTFISLGGATDSSYLEGHSYTYEGSICGHIISEITKSKCMNPIIYFDELDKVSETAKGDEIINVLMHLTDPSQNTHFHDKYFQGIDFDLSKAIIVFSYNDKYKINPILRDRITNINTKGFKNKEKIKIAKTYLYPKILKDVGISKSSIKLTDEVVNLISDNYTCEGGVRKLKECLYEIVREINLRELSNGKILGKTISYPFVLTNDIITKDLFKKKYILKPQMIPDKNQVGIVNGLYASSNDTGGITVVEAVSVPTSEKFGLELTGQQGDVMKESMKVSKSVAWGLLSEKHQTELQTKWKQGNSGIHIHCPEGSTPKDGPSAGGAITTAIVSLLTEVPINKEVAMTGEISLSGKITEIGGLASKLYGAKKAGVKLALIPKDNEKDFQDIIAENNDLLDNNFKVISVQNIHEVLDIALVGNYKNKFQTKKKMIVKN
jgi:endopeptidase La